MKRDAAEILALEVLAWIAGDEDRLAALMSASGAGLDALRGQAADPEFLGFVLDFVTAGDDALLAFCADAGRRPAELLAARAALPGGDLPNWT